MPTRNILMIHDTAQAIIVTALTICVVIGIIWVRYYSVQRRKKMEAADEGFRSRIPQYASVIRTWLEKERPYLDRSFRLVDVATVVPLNRTYLSRIFNEGLGESFSDMISRLRMDEAKRLLAESPETPIAEIAERCGFASHSSFHRAFVRYEGIKPGDYRQQHMA